MVKITPPKFHKEVPVAEAKAGDIVYFYSEKGGYRFGVLRQRRANSSPPTMTILPTGRHSVETVPASHVHNAFRDDLNAKETL
jgi:hypothetical protein